MRTSGKGIVMCALALAGCRGGERPKGVVADSAKAPAADAHQETMTAPTWRMDIPDSWDSRVLVIDDPGGLAALRKEGIHIARRFDYVPRDSSIVPQVLLGIFVYDSAAWAALDAEDGPPQGQLLARGPGVAYVAALPQSNPFVEGSPDSDEWLKREVNLEYLKQHFRVVR